VGNFKINPYIGLFIGVAAVSTSSAIFVKLVTAQAGVGLLSFVFFGFTSFLDQT